MCRAGRRNQGSRGFQLFGPFGVPVVTCLVWLHLGHGDNDGSRHRGGGPARGRRPGGHLPLLRRDVRAGPDRRAAAAAGSGSTPRTPSARPEGPAIWVAREGERPSWASTPPCRCGCGGAVARCGRPGEWTCSCGRRRAARAWARGSFTAWSDHVEVALGLGLTPSSYGLFKKLRYHDVGPVPFFQKVMDARAVASRRLGPVLGAIARRRGSRSAGRSGTRNGRARVGRRGRAHRPRSGPSSTRCGSARAASYAMCVRRDAAYLEWKYAALPPPRVHAARGAAARGARGLRGQPARGLPRAAPGLDRGPLRRRVATTTRRTRCWAAVLDSFRAAGVARAQAFAHERGRCSDDLRRRGFRRGRVAHAVLRAHARRPRRRCTTAGAGTSSSATATWTDERDAAPS